MRKELFMPSIEGQARLLILIQAFTTPAKSLEGRVKLAKLDFLLRYPNYFDRLLGIRAPASQMQSVSRSAETIESRMVRYRYGPWDPAYYSLLGGLIGKRLVAGVPTGRGIAYRVTPLGQHVAGILEASEVWQPVAQRAKLLRRYFDLSGTTLKALIYEHIPEVTAASWGEAL